MSVQFLSASVIIPSAGSPVHSCVFTGIDIRATGVPADQCGSRRSRPDDRHKPHRDARFFGFVAPRFSISTRYTRCVAFSEYTGGRSAGAAVSECVRTLRLRRPPWPHTESAAESSLLTRLRELQKHTGPMLGECGGRPGHRPLNTSIHTEHTSVCDSHYSRCVFTPSDELNMSLSWKYAVTVKF